MALIVGNSRRSSGDNSRLRKTSSSPESVTAARESSPYRVNGRSGSILDASISSSRAMCSINQDRISADRPVSADGAGEAMLPPFLEFDSRKFVTCVRQFFKRLPFEEPEL